MVDVLAIEAKRRELANAGTSSRSSRVLKYVPSKVHSTKYALKMGSVSDDFNVYGISKAVFLAVGGKETEDGDISTLNLLQLALERKLSNKKFLVVLDKKWRTLKRPFSVGSSASRILVTTRNTKVASAMNSTHAYPLDLLSDEDALSLFVEHASCEQNFDWNQALQLHGKDIIKKCDRLPLALRALGRVFGTKSNHEDWEELLNSELWKFDDNNEVIPALKLSYYDLPADLKRVFKYCCLFPKDYMFDKDELVLLWMAEGYLCNLDEDKPMEILGGEYFTELVSRSFFQRSSNDISRYTMHDLVHDLATSVAGEFFLKVDGKIDSYQRNGAFEKAHHVSFIHKQYEAYNKFKELLNARHLRTFLPTVATGLPQFENLNVPKKAILELFPQLKFLRVLSLAGYNITEVPESIGRFKHLRYLNISNTPIACLPEQVCDLQNLQSLLLYECYYLSSLPDSISKLINLRHLDLTRTPALKKMPLGISELKGLHTLTKVVIIGETDAFNISQLMDIRYIQGQLSIKGLTKCKMHYKQRRGNYKKRKECVICICNGVKPLMVQEMK
ncbi:putative disease resistance protein RGA3 [Bidens hawaiensis]|uniref:putative disease resistance protein RGA3 n=1 Tax=Bidens hawaiensis TaxID=980011 RepID=UPI0040492C25